MGVGATVPEHDEARAGDGLVAAANVVMDRAFTVGGTPEDVWPWIVQLGKRRAGWYFSRSFERVIPAGRRALRTIDPRWQALSVGDVVPDWGGRHATLTVVQLEGPHTLVYTSARGNQMMSWSIQLQAVPTTTTGPGTTHTRVLFRLRIGPVKRVRLATAVGGLFDALTIAGLAVGLRERVAET